MAGSKRTERYTYIGKHDSNNTHIAFMRLLYQIAKIYPDKCLPLIMAAEIIEDECQDPDSFSALENSVLRGNLVETQVGYMIALWVISNNLDRIHYFNEWANSYAHTPIYYGWRIINGLTLLQDHESLLLNIEHQIKGSPPYYEDETEDMPKAPDLTFYAKWYTKQQYLESADKVIRDYADRVVEWHSKRGDTLDQSTKFTDRHL